MGSLDPTAPSPSVSRSITTSSLLNATISLAVGGLVAALAWWATPRRLHAPLDIVGYPTINDFDFERQFVAYRLAVWLLPIVAILCYAGLRRWGPLSYDGGRRGDPALLDNRSGDGEGSRVPDGRGALWLAVLPPAALLAITVSAGRTSTRHGFTPAGLLLGLGYVGIVLTLGVLTSRTVRSFAGDRRRSTSMINAVAAATTAVWSFGHFADASVVLVAGGQIDRWAWVPSWLMVVLGVLAAAGTATALRRGVPAARVESGVVTLLTGTVALILLSSQLPGPVGQLQGFDDMQGITGADLLSRGYFPWRDFLFIHGVFEDALRSTVGYTVFEHTAWGSAAATHLIWNPVGWIGLYLLAAWAVPRNWAVMVATALVLVSVAQVVQMPVRWCFAAYVFILLGEAIRRRSAWWTTLLTSALFVEAILVPEAIYQVAAVVIVLFLVGVRHGARDLGLLRRFRLLTTFVGSGLVLALGWSAFLAANHALGSFVGYYLIFGPGHAASGTFPVGPYATRRYLLLFLAMTVLVCVTFAVHAWRWIERRPMSPVHWVLLASAVMGGLYGEKAVGRFDDPHIAQSLAVGLPMAVLWLTSVLTACDSGLAGRLRSALLRTAAEAGRPVGVLAIVLVVVAEPKVLRLAWEVSGNNKAVVPGRVAQLGYATPNAEDRPLLDDVGRLIHLLGGSHGDVFDFTNSPGIFHYLLKEPLSTKYFHVSMAIPEFAQKDLVDQLRRTRPAVVAYDSTQVGLARWDGVHNEVRHFLISEYLLNGWTPVVRSHGVLLMLRNDLVARIPSLPSLAEPPQTSGLYAIPDGCEWGAAAAYLQSSPAGRSVDLAVGQPTAMRTVTARGWAHESERQASTTTVLVAVDDVVVATTPADQGPPESADALGASGPGRSRFEVAVTTPLTGRISAYAVLGDGTVRPLQQPHSSLPTRHSLTMPDGSKVPVDPEAAQGSLDDAFRGPRTQVSAVALPAGTALASFDLATFSAGKNAIGSSSLQLTDTLSSTASSRLTVSASTVPGTGDNLKVRVGSCLSWHGFRGDTLYLLQRGGHPVDRIHLSGLA